LDSLGRRERTQIDSGKKVRELYLSELFSFKVLYYPSELRVADN